MSGAAIPLAASTSQVLGAVGLLIVVAIVGGVVILRVRRRLIGEDVESAGHGLLLADIRDMRARGEISEEEFIRLRDATLRAHGADPNRTQGAEGEGPEVDLTGDPLPPRRDADESPD